MVGLLCIWHQKGGMSRWQSCSFSRVQMSALPMNNVGTPLHLASHSGHVKMAELLIQCGAHVGSHDSKHQTPLHLAALKGNLDIVKLLFESGADCNMSVMTVNQTPLDMASDSAVTSFLSQSMTPPLTPPIGAPSLTTCPQSTH
jgi:ankyrin repeat protein